MVRGRLIEKSIRASGRLPESLGEGFARGLEVRSAALLLSGFTRAVYDTAIRRFSGQKSSSL